MCNEAPLPTLYILALVCTAKPFAVFFAFCGDAASGEVCFVDTLVVSCYLEELLEKCVCFTPCKLLLLLLPLSTCLIERWCIWRSSPFSPPVWITFRAGHVSLHSALSKLGCENLTLLFSDGCFRLSARMPSMVILEWPTCSSGCFWNFQVPRASLTGPWVNDLQYSQLPPFATVTFSLSDSFRGRLVDCFSLCGRLSGQSFPISHLSFSKNLQTGGMPRITLSIMTTISSFVVEARKTVLLSRWTFWPVVLSADLSLSTKILDRVPCPSLSLPGHHQTNMFQNWLSLPFSSAPFEEYAAAAWSLERSFWRQQHVLQLLLEDIIHHSPSFLLACRLSFQNNVLLIKCQSVLHECGLSHLPLVQVPDNTFIHIITHGCWCFFPGSVEHLEVVVVRLDSQQIIQVHRVPLSFVDAQEYFIPDWPAWKHWTFLLVVESPPRNWYSSWNWPVSSSWFLWRSSNQEFRAPFGSCRTPTLNGPILQCWIIEDELILGEKRLSKNWILTLAARVQIRMSLLHSFFDVLSTVTDRVSDSVKQLFCRRKGLRTIHSWWW